MGIHLRIPRHEDSRGSMALDNTDEDADLRPREHPDLSSYIANVKSLFPTRPSVERVVMYFKSATWSAVRKVFPGVTLQGFAFHWSQAVYRKVQDLGLTREYKEKGPSHDFIRKLLALPLLPHEHIPISFDNLRETATAPPPPPTAPDDIRQYHLDHWSPGQWTRHEWSVYGQSIRTNNGCEGWHRRLNFMTVGAPPFYLLVRTLHDESALLPMQKTLLCEKKLVKLPRKSTRSMQARIFTVWDKYSSGQISTSRLLRKLAAVYAPTL